MKEPHSSKEAAGRSDTQNYDAGDRIAGDL